MGKFTLQLTVRINQEPQYSGIQFEQNITFRNLLDFMQIAKILSQFHDLAERIKSEQR